jgi:aminoglycoside adenylyltransferase-like protein/nucleotidyltransferase-like protein
VTAPARPGWPTPWPEVDRAVERLLDGVVEAVGGDLVGLYLGGSLGLGDFDPASSDVDVLVATARALPTAAVEGLRRLHGALHAEGGWAARLEVVYLPLATLRRFDPEDTARYPVGASEREFTLGRQGPTWVLDRWMVREHGLVVTGPDPRDLIDPIGPDELRAAVRASLAGLWARVGEDAGWLRPRNDQAFAVLSMCRDLYVLERGMVASKPAAAAWASRRLGPPWPAMIEQALAWRSDRRVDDRHLPETLAFVAHTVGLAGVGG